MKKAMVTMLMVLMLSAVACAGDVNVWLYGIQNMVLDPDGQEAIGLRIGTTLGEENNLEVGIASQYYVSDEGSDLPQVWAAYGLYYLPYEVNVPQPIPFEWLPKELTAKPYIGAQVGMDFDADGVISGPLAGAVIQEIMFVEYQYTNATGQISDAMDDEHRVLFGLKFSF